MNYDKQYCDGIANYLPCVLQKSCLRYIGNYNITEPAIISMMNGIIPCRIYEPNTNEEDKE